MCSPYFSYQCVCGIWVCALGGQKVLWNCSLLSLELGYPSNLQSYFLKWVLRIQTQVLHFDSCISVRIKCWGLTVVCVVVEGVWLKSPLPPVLCPCSVCCISYRWFQRKALLWEWTSAGCTWESAITLPDEASAITVLRWQTQDGILLIGWVWLVYDFF